MALRKHERRPPVMEHLWNTLEKQVFGLDSTDELFNPYKTRHPTLDCENAPAIRKTNFKRYFEDHARGVKLLLVAEAPGPWGCRFSGVPITSEAHLVNRSFPLQGQQTSLGDEPLSEYSAGIFWRALQPFYDSFFTWNTLPLHPHRCGEPLSIRTPRQSEMAQFYSVLDAVVQYFSPEIILAIGRKAENALTRIGASATYVRHPSQGGARLFEQGVLSTVEKLGLRPSQ